MEFFLKNNGEEEIGYNREIKINSVIKGVDEAVRVAVYINKEKNLYAKKSNSGNPEPGTKPFFSTYQILNEERLSMKPGDVDRYTVIIWLEGEDPECVDDIIGGEMKMEMLIKELSPETMSSIENDRESSKDQQSSKDLQSSADRQSSIDQLSSINR